MRKRLLAWSDYIYIGLAFAMLLSLRNEFRDGYCQIIPVIVFLFFTGIKDNIKIAVSFVSNFPILTISTIVWTIYFTFKSHAYISNRYAITVFGVIYAGYCISYSGEDVLNSSMEKLWNALFILETIGIINYLVVHDFEERMYMFFTNSIAEGDVVIVLAMISLFYIENMKKKLAGIALSIVVVVMGSLRTASLMLVLLLGIYLVYKRREIIILITGKFAKHKGRKLVLVTAISAGLIISCAILITHGRSAGFLGKLFERFQNALSSFTKDPYINYYGDLSLRIRIIAVDQALSVFHGGTLFEKILGHELQYGYRAIKPAMMTLTQMEGSAAGPIENTFIGLLVDFGALSFVLFLGVYICALTTAARSKMRSVRIHSIFVVVIITLSAFIDMEYWINLIFFVWIFVGIYLGELVKKDEKKAILPSLMFSTALTLVICYLPHTNSFLRTLINSMRMYYGKTNTMVIFVLGVIFLIASLWILCSFIARVILDHKMEKTYAISFAAAIIICMFILGGGIAITNKTKVEQQERIDAGAEIINTVIDNSKGVIYNDTFPLHYSEKYGDIEGTLFSGASLAANRYTTVITSREKEQYLLSRAGFLYTPISDWDVIYTNDSSVVEALKKKGYNLTGFNTEVRELQCVKEAYNKDGCKELAFSALDDTDIYPGEYTVTFKMSLQSVVDGQDTQVCQITLSAGDGTEELISVPVLNNMFGDDGKIVYEVPFSISDQKYGLMEGSQKYEFKIIFGSNYELSVDSVTYKRTPEKDTRIIIDEVGRITREEYFDLSGKPILGSAGNHGMEYEYVDNYSLNKKLRRFLGMDLKPVMINDGYSEVHIEFDEQGRIAKVSYFDLDGNLVKEE